jgi:16S rRNA (uracil1498-N3)-methyltransferase
MHRFHIPLPDISKKVLTITDRQLLHQLNKVLRMKPKDFFTVFNNKNDEWKVCILELDRKHCLGQVVEPLFRNTEPSIEVSLYQAIPKKPVLFELIIQKATELGVSSIYPLITERTEKRRLGKFERMTAIAREATEQSGRLKIPMIRHPVSLAMALEQVTNAYVAYEFEDKKFLSDYGQFLYESGTTQIIIGPEGGFTNAETDAMKKAHVRSFSLGPRILRLETAAVVTLGLLLSSRKAYKFSSLLPLLLL